LKDAVFLIELLDEVGIEEAHRRMNRYRGIPHQSRRASICLDLMANAEGEAGQDRTDRLRARLNLFVLTAMTNYDAWLDHRYYAAGCGCGYGEVTSREKPGRRGRRYELGPDHCNSLPAGQCGIVAFLRSSELARSAILAYLAEVPEIDKSKEIIAAEKFLKAIEQDLHAAPDLDPCLSVGDLLVALESASAKAGVVYTMNGTESQHMCRALRQGLIVRPPDPLKADEVCPAGEPQSWRRYGPAPRRQKGAASEPEV
jgi:hypothetical protein